MTKNAIHIELNNDLSVEEFNEIIEIIIKYGYNNHLPNFSFKTFIPKPIKITGNKDKLNKYSKVFYEIFKEQGHIFTFTVIK